jgi:Tfp pilus assembly protein PilV
MIACVILAVAMVGIGGSLSATVKQSAAVEQDSTALLLARELMEEIVAKPYMDPTSATITTATVAAANQTAAASASLGHAVPARAALNDVGDYNGYTDTIDSSHLATSLQGATASVTNNRKYVRAVAVQFRTSPSGTAVTSGDFAMITVTVTTQTGQTVSISRLATNTTLLQQ